MLPTRTKRAGKAHAEMLQPSAQGVVNLLEAIQEAGLDGTTRFFEASSCEIFGRASRAPVNEQSAKHPQNPYGKAKLLGYLAVKHYRYVVAYRDCAVGDP